MFNNVMVKDVLEAFVINDNGKSYFYGATEEGSISQGVDQQPLTAGIGNKVKAILQTQKEVTFTVKNLFHNDSFLAMQSGSDFTIGSRDIMHKEEVVAVDNLGSIQCTITGTPKDDIVYVADKFGVNYPATFSAGVVTITTGGVAGKLYTISYLVTNTAVSILPSVADKYPTTKHIQLHGIAYDPDTNIVVADIYYDFKLAMPDGNVERAYGKGENTPDSITFTTLEDDAGNYGEYYVIAR